MPVCVNADVPNESVDLLIFPETPREVRVDVGSRGQQERHGAGVHALQHHQAKDRVVGSRTEMRRRRRRIRSLPVHSNDVCSHAAELNTHPTF